MGIMSYRLTKESAGEMTDDIEAEAAYRATLRTATRSNGVVDTRVGAVRSREHRLIADGVPGKAARKSSDFSCSCGYHEGVSATLDDARNRHGVHVRKCLRHQA